MITVSQEHKRLAVQLALRAARRVLPKIPVDGRGLCESAIVAAEAWVEDPSDATMAAADAAADAVVEGLPPVGDYGFAVWTVAWAVNAAGRSGCGSAFDHAHFALDCAQSASRHGHTSLDAWRLGWRAELYNQATDKAELGDPVERALAAAGGTL